MSYNFTDEDRETANQDRTERMPFGINVVKLVGATANENKDGKEFLEVTVANAAGLEDTAKFWFTGGASPYSLQKVQQIVVHSAKTDSAKEQAREAVQAIKDLDALASMLNSKCVGAEAWLTKYYDPSRTYQNQNGDTKRSINTELTGYEPVLKPELMPAPADEIIPVEGNITDDGKINIPGQWN